MIALVKIINESVRQALQQLTSNKLRTFLSLLGITIGILCIIGVKSGVDSLENNIRGSFEKLGDDVLYVDKWEWGGGPEYPWWEYMKRPAPDFSDYRRLTKKMKTAESIYYACELGSTTLKYRSSSVEGVRGVAVSIEFSDATKMEFYRGRFYSPSEYYYGSPKIVLG